MSKRRYKEGKPANTVLLCLVALLALSGCGDSENHTATDAGQPQSASVGDADQQWALLERYCSDCHNLDDYSGGLALDLLDHQSIAADAETWEKIVRKLRGRMMPPPGQERPGTTQVDTLVAWLEDSLDAASPLVQPGTKPLHRLNRTEYGHAIRDLLQLEVDAEALLPLDGAEDGFDNIASALQITPTFVDQYLDAARIVSDQAIGTATARPSGTSYGFAATGQSLHMDGLPLGTRGGGVIEHYFPSDGDYILNIGSMAGGLAPGGLEHRSTLIATLDGRKIFETEIGGLEEAERIDKLRAAAVDELNARLRNIPFSTTAGPHKVAVFFLQRSFAESDAPLQQLVPGAGQDAVARLGQFEIYGPTRATGLATTPSRAKIFSCHPERDAGEESCAREILQRLADEAFRGQLDDADTALLLRMYEAGNTEGGFERGIAYALSGILAHPKFLYRIEPIPSSLPPGGVQELDSLELASRLSFFLWSSIPDETLLEIAADGRLVEPAVLEAQVQRMLQDPRATNLASNFGYQWLGLAELDTIAPDGRLFRDVPRNLRSDLKQEAVLFMQSIFAEDRSVVDLLSADHSYLNESLALHYGIGDVRGSHFRRVQLRDERRWGLLGKGAVLMVSSYPNRTSPVLRGKWLLEKVFGTPPAAPPPEVEGFVEIEVGQEFTTVRERLETHRDNPSCNGCHGVIDPLGFALENFDAVGRWQDMDRMARTPIDSSGVMADGTPVNGPLDLRQAILARPEQFVQTFTEKLMTFALGRGIGYPDMPTVRRIVREAGAEDYRFSALVAGIVASEQFRMKQQPDAALLVADGGEQQGH